MEPLGLGLDSGQQLLGQEISEAYGNFELPERVVTRRNTNHVGRDQLTLGGAVEMEFELQRLLGPPGTLGRQQGAATAGVIHERRVREIPLAIDRSWDRGGDANLAA